MDFHLAKPFSPEEIVQVIRRFMPDRAEPVAKDSSNEGANNSPPLPRVFDRDGFLQRIGGNVRLYDELIPMFFERFPEVLAELLMSVKKSDIEKIYLRSHSLKGSCLTIGANVLADVARKIEDAARHKGSIEDIRLLAEALEPAFREFFREAGKYR